MIDDRNVIEHSCTPEQWDEFEQRIEMLQPDERAKIAQRLGVNLPEGSLWQEYRDEFARYSWWDFTEAYEYVMRTSY